MNRDDRLIWLTGAGLLALAAWWWQADNRALAARGGVRRELAPSAVLPAPLDAALGQVTPEQLLHYGPTRRPASWRGHQVRYPATPGAELARLQCGVPGSSATAVPRALRGWLFAPPAEEDY